MVIFQVAKGFKFIKWPLMHGKNLQKSSTCPNDAIIVAFRAHVGVLLVRRRVAKGIQVIPEDGQPQTLHDVNPIF
jgi:hypothetical protein